MDGVRFWSEADPSSSGFEVCVSRELEIDRTGHVRLTHTGYNSSETSFRRDLTQLLQSL